MDNMDWFDEDVDDYDDDYNKFELGRYYWKTKEGKLIKVDDLEESHIRNIVIMVGSINLAKQGYKNIVDRFKKLERER
jgi:hypothetical protein